MSVVLPEPDSPRIKTPSPFGVTTAPAWIRRKSPVRRIVSALTCQNRASRILLGSWLPNIMLSAKNS